MKIPIENLFRILCYAWSAIDEGRAGLAGEDTDLAFPDLLGKLLARTSRYIRARGISRGYVAKTESLRGMKGKLLISQSLAHLAFERAAAVCEYDELSPDLIENQIIKHIIQRLLSTDLDAAVKQELFTEIKAFNGVSLVRDFPRISARSYQSLSALYRFAIRLCRLLDQNLVPTTKGESFSFRSFADDEKQMRKIFELFVRNFVRYEIPVLKASERNFKWAAKGLRDSDVSVLPNLKTDATFINGRRMLVIEVKYVAGPLYRSQFRDSMISAHINQIFAYVANLKFYHADKAVEGLLIYPSVGPAQKYEYELFGNKLTVASIDLNQSWQRIREDLITLVA